MDAVSLQEGTYRITENLTINQIIVSGNFSETVELTFTNSIVLGKNYEVTLSGMTDCSGNQVLDTTFSFSFGRSPNFNEVLITEILYDETPSLGLPEREYIEIYNNSDDVISTESLFFVDGSGAVSIPPFNMSPRSYKILTSSSGSSEFQEAIGIVGFPSLSNSGEYLALTDSLKTIFSITYNPTWHTPMSVAGGYSLEMIDLTHPCVESGANWTSSISTIGGTPGAINSVFDAESVPDNMPPKLLNVTAISVDTLVLTFDEKLDQSNPLFISYTFSPALTVEKSVISLDRINSVYSILSSELIPNQLYSLAIEGVTDCSGNEIGENEITFALPIQADEGEVLLSEILFNPRTNGVDFIELYNNSENFISLKNWKLARITNEMLGQHVIISEDELVLPPNDFLVLTENPEILFSNYPKGIFSKFLEVTPFPVYSNTSGNVVVLNSLEEIVEQFLYDESDHYSLLEDVDGVSLERISYNESANNSDNWRSSSSTEGFATPGYANSQSVTNRNNLGGVISLNSKVFIPSDAGQGQNFILINYQLDTPGKFANIDIYNSSGRLVKHLANGVLLATTGFLRWDGDIENGSIAKIGHYLIVFNIYDGNGNSEIIKETVVVGRNF